jgi:hypothetical protein
MSNDERATLPPLPHPVRHDFTGEDTEDLFTADQMRAYAIQARAAIAQQPAIPQNATEAMQKAMIRQVMLRKSMNDVWQAALSELPEFVQPHEGAAIAQPADWRLTAARFLRDEDAQRSHLGYANRTHELVSAAEKLEQLASASPYGLDCADPTLKAAQPAEPALTECADNDSPWLVCKPCAAAGKCANASDVPPLVTRLRQERRPTAWTRGLDTDYPTAWEPNLLCHEAAAEIVRLRCLVEAVRGEFKRECNDADAVLHALGLDPEKCRTDGGGLKLAMLLGALAHRDVMTRREARRAEIERCADVIARKTHLPVTGDWDAGYAAGRSDAALAIRVTASNEALDKP